MKRVVQLSCLASIFALTNCSSIQSERQSVDPVRAGFERVAKSGVHGYKLELDAPRPYRLVVSGNVASEHDRQIVLNALKADSTIEQVDDHLKVSGVGGSASSPGNIQALNQKILGEVSTFPLVGNLHLKLSTDSSGQLTIAGEAPNQAVVSRIKTAAERQLGGQEVLIKISIPQPPPDSVILQRILDDLNSDLEIDTSRFRLSVIGQIVTVTGHFPKHEEVDRILAKILMADGVKDVRFLDPKGSAS